MLGSLPMRRTKMRALLFYMTMQTMLTIQVIQRATWEGPVFVILQYR